MLAAPAAAVVAQVPAWAMVQVWVVVVPALAGVALAVLPQRVALMLLPRLAVLSPPAVVVDLAQPAVGAEVSAEEALVHLRSRQSFSAAMARTTP
jgi:hypothetical protein